MTYVKVRKFDFECMEKNSNRYKFLWKHATEIVLILPNGQRVSIKYDPNENIDYKLDKLIDSLLKNNQFMR